MHAHTNSALSKVTGTELSLKAHMPKGTPLKNLPTKEVCVRNCKQKVRQNKEKACNVTVKLIVSVSDQ